MKSSVATILLLTLPMVAAAQSQTREVKSAAGHESSCVIVKRMGTASELTSHLYTFGIHGKQFQYLEGDFPEGTKFRSRLTDNDVRQILDSGGKVEVTDSKYSEEDLAAARKRCTEGHPLEASKPASDVKANSSPSTEAANRPLKPPVTSAAPSVETISVTANLEGAEIYADGEFVGNTPAVLKLSPGKHTVKVTKAGFKDWEREISTQMGSDVHLVANLEKPAVKANRSSKAPASTVSARSVAAPPAPPAPNRSTPKPLAGAASSAATQPKTSQSVQSHSTSSQPQLVASNTKPASPSAPIVHPVNSTETTSVAAAISKVPEMIAWQDPTERAFTVNVPKGWRINGGTHRNSKTDARSYVDAQSPDGKIHVWMNSPDVLPRQEPHPGYYRLGWYEGRTVQSPMGPLTIERFKSGAQFAQEFTAAKMCRSLQPLSAFDLRKESQQMNSSFAGAAARANAHVQASAGELVYRCGEESGYTFAVTVLAYTSPQGPHTWSIEKLSGYLSDKADGPTARYILNAMVSSYRVDPNWQARYEREIQDTTGALMQISNQITQQSIQLAQQSLQQNMRQVQERQKQFDQMSQMREESFKRQMNSQDAIRQRWSDITLGQIHGCDDLGNCSTVSNDYQNYWTKDGRTVVGGPSDGSPPGPEFHKWTPDY